MTTMDTAIRAFDCVDQFHELRDEIMGAIESVLSSGSLILGPQVQRFEADFSRYLYADGMGVGVGNGTDAIAIALRSLEIGPGDEVITVANTAIPTVSAIRMTGARPVFCDVDPRTLLMDIDAVEERITARTKAVVPVHLYGNAVDMPRLMNLAIRHGLAVVEDCAQSCGTTWQGQMTGTFGDIGCFSFYPTKNLGAYGDAGFCFTRHKQLAETMAQLRGYGCNRKYLAEREGVNSRLDELQAAILNVKLRHLGAFLSKRRAVARVYREELAPTLVRPAVPREADHSYHLFVVIAENRPDLIARLQSQEIGFGVHYATPIHRMGGYEFLGYRNGSLPVTERLARQVLSLPCYPELPHEAVRRICSVVNDAAGTAI